MGDNNKIVGIIVVIVIIALIALLGSCSSDDYSRTLNDGQRKYYSGEKMTEKEYKAVERYNNWKSKQSPKTYSEWSK